ncbi:hypothetical protein TPHA_0F02900 [Tetrapisispora phaffii CBS 4417]|uniref:ERAD-associated E3 ubiquitin-protein ligase component HRD3 n=1 Tax=Tetrapisispora phaffii (strain ATCC 24235 / CBS 4417 / NBRC 1672 / NRRL Y-8282 / UCD 70-5) TaxID=1071381 RepID=G8BUI5_TETPH|nr:hypothetical protein TPHA_0F02900 [Tetrapisispora phaffii CBS 4417]CCE63771.1 hypothetical protein TPHA_0F02900 [Tetrapisispora phaffii CBS 4417]
MLLHRLCFTLVVSVNVLAQLVDPWNDVKTLLNEPQFNVDYFASDNKMLDSKRLQLSDAYSPEQQLKEYDEFWNEQNSTNSLQLKLYNDLQISAEKFNNAEALYKLANINLLGSYGLPQNKTLAVEYLMRFNEVTNYTNSTGLFEMAVIYSTGLLGTIPIDTPKSLVYYEKSALLGDIRAKQALAYRYLAGLNVPRDCDKALLLYREVADYIKNTYTPEEWNIFFPPLETYNIRVSDFEDGLIGSGLNTISASLTRTPSQKPDLSSIFYTQMNEGRIVLSFTSENMFADDDDQMIDELVDIYYTALDMYKGTYNKRRDPERARIALENVYMEYDDTTVLMENIQLYFYSKCIDLLGHLYLTGEGVPTADVATAEFYLKRSVEVLKPLTYIRSGAYRDLGLISQYAYNNITKAAQYYKYMTGMNDEDGNDFFQLSKISIAHPEMKLGDPFVLMQQAYSRGHVPSIYEFAKMLEDGFNNQHSCDDTAFLYKHFIEKNDHISAPQLKEAYVNLLLGKTEAAIWGYLQAGEQGWEPALVSTAYLLYRMSPLLDDEYVTSEERKQLSISYYSRAFNLHNTDAGVIAGNLYYNMGDYPRAITMYQSASLRYSSSALWNLGYMYEYGLGVEKDYYLAKRFYDEALEYDKNILLGVKLSLLKLQLKAWWSRINGYNTSSDDKNIDLFNSIPWYMQIITIFKNIINDNSRHSRTGSNADFHFGTYITTITEILGLTTEDLYGVAIVGLIFLFYILVRAIARRQGVQIRVNDQRLV